MHFSRTYAQLLANLPPDLQECTIQYRQLKKIINQIVEELSSYGLNPALLHRVLERQDAQIVVTSWKDSSDTSATTSLSTSGRVPGSSPISIFGRQGLPRVVYELHENSDKIEPRLRIPVGYLRGMDEGIYSPGTKGGATELVGQNGQKGRGRDSDIRDGFIMDSSGSGEIDRSTSPQYHFLWDSQDTSLKLRIPLNEGTQVGQHEVVIPLVCDSQFFELLCAALDYMGVYLKSVEDNLMEELKTLASDIGKTTRPSSSCHSSLRRNFRPTSPLDNPSSISSRPSKPSKSDLYPWREVLRLYIEAEIFESIRPKDGRERSVEESEQRLQLFADQVVQWPKANFKLKESCRSLEAFLKFNFSILNIKKLLLANSEATREIIKKRTKRTALPFPPNSPSSSDHSSPRLALILQINSLNLPRVLAQAIGESLIPIIPHVDDYSCLICTSIAFKPIRLDCKHVFCVRCLVKMQKRGKDNCPMCRAPSVLIADRSNVDWALMNFMQDWFPDEIREKLDVDGKEVNAEQLAELGYNPNASCVIM